MKKLDNKVAFVTGGSRGIGAAITKKLAEEGAAVVLTYNNSAEKAEAIAAEINNAGGQALAVAADSADPKSLENAIKQATDKFGKIDILVNNAGIYIGKPFEEHTLDDYERIMAVNVRAVYVASQAALKTMPNGGRIITIGSNMGDNAVMPQSTFYTMSKAALQGFTRGLARDLGPKKITVNLVQPGPVDTDMNPAASDFAQMMKSRIALGEYGHVNDIANLVAFLADEENGYITGSALTIDGGFNA